MGRYAHTAVWLNGLVYVGGGIETKWELSTVMIPSAIHGILLSTLLVALP